MCLPGEWSYFDETLNTLVTPQNVATLPIDRSTSGGVVTNVNTGLRVDPAVMGDWTGPTSIGGTAIHASVLPNGRVQWWDFTNVREMNASTLSITHNSFPGYEVFCSGHAFLPDGRLLVAGGQLLPHQDGLVNTSIYNPTTRTWTRVADMYQRRWYPTNTALGDGDVLVLSGRYVSGMSGGNPVYATAQMPQVWDYQTSTWRNLSTAQRSQWLYPWMFLAPDGRVFDAGPGRTTAWLNTSGTGQWTNGPNSNYGNRDYGTAVMYRPGKILIVGGSRNIDGEAPTNTAEIIDLNQPNPTWQYTGSMQYRRRQTTATLLPDGRVLVTGGSTAAGFNTAGVGGTDVSAYAAEIWDPDTGVWTTVDQMSVRRLYHSTALLLPDGRVLSMGGGAPSGTGSINGGNDFDHSDAEFYSPSYLFNGARPTITSAPTSVPLASQFTISTPDASSIGKVTLVRVGSVTHGMNMDQRLDVLNFTAGAGSLTIDAPANPNAMPPGPYMLFIINDQGVPSAAAMMTLGFDTVAPTVSASSFEYQTAHKVTLQFSEDINPATLQTTDLSVQLLASGPTINPNSFTYNAATRTATFNFNSPLSLGNHRATLAAGSVLDRSGNPLASAHQLGLFVLGGDANRDRYVDAADQSIVTKNLNQPGNFGDGDFNYDGTVNAADQAILDSNWHVWLPEQGALSLPATTEADAYALERSGNLLHAYRNGDSTPTYRIPLSAVTAFTFDGGGGNDSLTILGSTGADVVTFNATSMTFAGVTVAHASVESLAFDGKRGGDSLTITGGPTVSAVGLQVLSSLSIAPNATLDLNDNDLIVDYALLSQLTTIQALINSARSGGTWTGTGIMSSAAKNANPQNTTLGVMEASDFKSIYGPSATFAGETIDSTAVLVKYTYYGDADFSGTVNFDDYARIDNGFSTNRTGWLNGDFDGNGTVNFDDYSLIDLAFNSQSGPPRNLSASGKRAANIPKN